MYSKNYFSIVNKTKVKKNFDFLTKTTKQNILILVLVAFVGVTTHK
jgi:hypothetical protein